ncbi:hypothetical protein Hte_012249 [Hypoxylon texense]
MADAAVKCLAGHQLEGCQLRVERKTSKEPRTVKHIRSVPVFPDDPDGATSRQSLLRKQASQRELSTDKHVDKAEPATPGQAPESSATLKTGNSTGPVPGSAPSSVSFQGHQYNPFSYGNHGYPLATPYTNPLGSGSFMTPITPQGMPGMPGMHGMPGSGPFPPYFGSPYWMTPYLQDPSLAMGLYPQQHYSPMAAGMSATTMGESMAEAPVGKDSQTPTKINPGKSHSAKRLDDA